MGGGFLMETRLPETEIIGAAWGRYTVRRWSARLNPGVECSNILHVNTIVGHAFEWKIAELRLIFRVRTWQHRRKSLDNNNLQGVARRLVYQVTIRHDLLDDWTVAIRYGHTGQSGRKIWSPRRGRCHACDRPRSVPPSVVRFKADLVESKGVESKGSGGIKGGGTRFDLSVPDPFRLDSEIRFLTSIPRSGSFDHRADRSSSSRSLSDRSRRINPGGTANRPAIQRAFRGCRRSRSYNTLESIPDCYVGKKNRVGLSSSGAGVSGQKT